MAKLLGSFQAWGEIPDVRDLWKIHSNDAVKFDQQRSMKTDGVPSGPKEDVVGSFIKANSSCLELALLKMSDVEATVYKQCESDGK